MNGFTYMMSRYDHRAFGDLSSKSFYSITVKVFQSKDIKVYGFNQFAFTPLVVFFHINLNSQPFSISHYNCCAGIMITASHNPAADDGYKIYWENGCQIIPPHDEGISRSIQKNLQPWRDYTAITELVTTDITEQAIKAYMNHTVKLLHMNSKQMNDVTPSLLCKQTCPSICYTAMHGVGAVYVRELLQQFELPAVQEVTSQIEPDPTFPTVVFPNPEEKGVFSIDCSDVQALDIALSEADKKNCQYVMATDPDADRFICAEKIQEHVY